MARIRLAVLAGLVLAVAAAAYLADRGWRLTEPAPEALPEASVPAQPPPPAAEQPAAAVPPSFDVVRVNPSGGAVFAGRAEPGSEVTVLMDGRPVGTAAGNAAGEWVLVLDQAIPPGSHEFALRASRQGVVLSSEDVVMMMVPKAKEDVAGRPAAETGEALALMVPREGEGLTVLQAPTGESATGEPPSIPTGGRPLSVVSVEYDARGRIAVGGRAEPGARVQVYLDNELVGAASGEASGRWRVSPDRSVAEGEHRIRVDRVDAEGKVLDRVETPFARAATVAMQEGERLVVVQPGTSLWRIAWISYGEGPRYAVIYAANQQQIADPDMIFPGQVFLVPAAEAGGIPE